MNNIVEAVFGTCNPYECATRILYRYDYGMILTFPGLDLPTAYEVHFSNYDDVGTTITQIGNDDGVSIPDEFLQTGLPVYCWVYLHTGEDDGETVYKVTINVQDRPQPSNGTPTPVQQDAITEAIAALDSAVEQTGADASSANADALKSEGYAVGTQDGEPVEQGSPYYRHNSLWLSQQAGQSANKAEAQASLSEAWAVGEISGHPVPSDYPQYENNSKYYAEQASHSAEDAEESAQSVLGLTADATVDSNVGTPSVSVSVTTESDHKNMSFAFHNLKGVQGDTGVGISSVVLNADYTLTITLTNGTSYTTSSIRGEVGATPNLTIGTVSTLPEGSQATATITGTDEDPVLNLGIPVGDTGDPGISPTITVTEITGGHEVEVVDAEGTQTFDVLDGEVSEEQLETALIDKADVITSNASGEIVTISDGGADLPVVDLSVSLLPVQDLHGQDAPYPAGGGANKWNEEWEVGAFNTSTGADTTGQPTQIRSKGYISVLPSTAYYFYKSTNDYMWFMFFDADKNVITTGFPSGYAQTSNNARGYKPGAYTMPSNCYFIRFYTQTGYGSTYNHDLGINYPSTVTTYAPYSNICPISGWTGVEIHGTGKNLIEPKFYSGIVYNPDVGASAVTTLTDVTNTVTKEGNTYSKTGSAWGIPMSMVLPLTDAFVGKTLKFSGTINEISGYRCAWIITDSEYITKRKAIIMSAKPTWSITIQKGDAYLIWYMNSSSAGTYTLTEPQIEVGSTATAYEAYQGEIIPIDWTDEAGTVYGGSLDLTTGVLTVDSVLLQYPDITWEQINANNGFKAWRSYVSSTLATKSGASALSNMVAEFGSFSSASMTKNIIQLPAFVNNKWVMYMALQEDADPNDVQVWYQLATAQTFQLSETQIATYLGVNNFWSNGNGSLDLEYRCDTKLYIENLTKPSEDDMTANANIASGKFFMIGNRLMLSTTAIAQGEQIVVGTNCSEISLADALNQINA